MLRTAVAVVLRGVSWLESDSAVMSRVWHGGDICNGVQRTYRAVLFGPSFVFDETPRGKNPRYMYAPTPPLPPPGPKRHNPGFNTSCGNDKSPFVFSI